MVAHDHAVATAAAMPLTAATAAAAAVAATVPAVCRGHTTREGNCRNCKDDSLHTQGMEHLACRARN